MTRSRNSAMYPESFWAILEKVGRDGGELEVTEEEGGNLATLRANLQAFLAAVRREGSGAGDMVDGIPLTPKAELAAQAMKVVVRVRGRGEGLVVGNRNNDIGGKGVEAALARLAAGGAGQTGDRAGGGKGEERGAPGKVVIEGGASGAGQGQVGRAWTRKDGLPVPVGADGQPVWGFGDDGEPKCNQYY